MLPWVEKLNYVCHSCQAPPRMFPAALIRKWLAYIMAIIIREKESQIIVDRTKTFSVSRSGTTVLHKPEAQGFLPTSSGTTLSVSAHGNNASEQRTIRAKPKCIPCSSADSCCCRSSVYL